MDIVVVDIEDISIIKRIKVYALDLTVSVQLLIWVSGKYLTTNTIVETMHE